MASEPLEMSSRRNISLFEYREWMMRSRSSWTSVLNFRVDFLDIGLSRSGGVVAGEDNHLPRGVKAVLTLPEGSCKRKIVMSRMISGSGGKSAFIVRPLGVCRCFLSRLRLERPFGARRTRLHRSLHPGGPRGRPHLLGGNDHR